MTNMWVICLNTFREAVRNKILYLVVAMALLVILTSKAVGWVLIGEDLKVMTDISLMSMSLFGAMVTVFLGTGLIYLEIDKRTIYVILSRPVARWEYVLGKYLGLLLTVYVALLVLAVAFLGYLWVMSWEVFMEPSITPGEYVTVPFGPVLFAIFMTFVEMMLVTGMAIAFSAASTPVTSAVFTTIAYVVGHSADRIYDLAKLMGNNPQTGKGSETAESVILFFYYTIPNLAMFNVRNEAVHGTTSEYAWSTVFFWLGYGFAFTAAFLILGILVFRRRNF